MRFSRRPVRRGATLVETAVTILAFLVLVLGMLDLGVGVLHRHMLSDAARHGARLASVHGEKAGPGSVWGTSRIDLTADSDAHPIVGAIRPLLTGFDLSKTHVIVEWPGADGVTPDSDDSNKIGQPVRVTVYTGYQPLVTYIFGTPSIKLTATSTMLILH
jgi:hypothetical protein